MVLAAVEQNESPGHRLVDDLAARFLPAPLRALVWATRSRMLRNGLIAANERVGAGSWAPMACRKHFIDDKLVAVDFERDDLITVLAEHGYRRDARTFFIWEGVTQYLTPDAVRATLDQLRQAAPGSRLAVTYVCQDFIDGRNMYGTPWLHRRFVEPLSGTASPIWKSGLDPAGVAEFLAGYGWRLAEEAGPQYYLDHYLRPAGRTLDVSGLERTVYAEKM
jgi:O-methyltransferase involved in polyketide biosynthesis